MKNLSQITRSIGPAARSAWSWLGLLYAQPIPIGETIYLWRYAADRDDRLILRRNLRGFLARTLTVLAVLATSWASWRIYTRLPSTQVDFIIHHAPIEIGEQGSNRGGANRP